MLRSALPLSVALALLCGSAVAHAARTTTSVAGDVRALAFAGGTLAIARVPPRGGLTLARHDGAAAAQPLLTTSLRSDDDQIMLAASSQAVAIGLQPDGGDALGASRAFIGPASGPLREVAVCPAGVLAPPVAVSGARIAWRDGACAEPAERPTAVTPAAIMIGAADAAIAPTRLALGADVLPATIVLAGAGGMIGTLRPSFFAVDSEVRAFSALGIGATLLSERGRIVSPAGVLADGTRVFALATLEQDEDGGACTNALFTIAAGATQRRELDLGGCLLSADVPTGPAGVRVAGSRIFALVSAAAADGSPRGGPPRVALVSVRGDGGDRRVHAHGSYRPPLGLAADGDRVAYWHQSCAAASSNVVVADGAAQDAGPAAIASCRVRVLTRLARVREGRITIALRCPSGCRGVAVEIRRELPRRLRTFAFARGTHTIRVRLSKATRRRGRLRLQLAIDAGPERSAVIRLRR